jgi:predicted Fe-Mo cluster-binding NifX family protein
MKICIPVLEEKGFDSRISSHFGQADMFAMVDSDTNDISFLANTGEHHGGVLAPPELLHQAGIDLLICGGLGGKAVQMFQGFGIEVYSNASGTVSDALDAYRAGKLAQATKDTACQHHAH